MTARRVLLAGLLVVAAGVAGFAVLAWHPALPPAAAAAAPPEPAPVARGAELAALGNCASCHSAAGGAPYAGGRGIRTPFGTVYATNITPDPDTGIGTWSQEAFNRSMREGLDREGRHLYPAFPYNHYRVVPDAELVALFAFLRSLAPVRATAPANELVFPLGFRPLLAGWKLLFLPGDPVRPDPARSEAWNRGALLVEGLGHCGACHSPRNALGAEKRDHALGGGLADGWDAPPLVAALSWAPAPWSEESLFNYLRHGMDGRHGAAGGPMQAVSHALAAAPEADVRAMAVFLATLQAPAAPVPAANAERPWPEATAADDPGAVVFAGACAVCHAAGTPTAQAGFPSLLLGSALNGPSPRNAINAVLNGLGPLREGGAPLMAPYADMLADDQVAAVLRFMRAAVPGKAPWPELEKAVAAARKEGA